MNGTRTGDTASGERRTFDTRPISDEDRWLQRRIGYVQGRLTGAGHALGLDSDMPPASRAVVADALADFEDRFGPINAPHFASTLGHPVVERAGGDEDYDGGADDRVRDTDGHTGAVRRGDEGRPRVPGPDHEPAPGVDGSGGLAASAGVAPPAGGDEAAGGEEVIRQAIYDPGRFVKRDFEWGEPRWEGDSAAYEPLHVWQTRAVLAALAPAGSPEAPEPEEFDAICRATLGHELDGETVAEAAVRLIERATAPAVSEREVRERVVAEIVEALRARAANCERHGHMSAATAYDRAAHFIEGTDLQGEIAAERGFASQEPGGVALDEEAADGE